MEGLTLVLLVAVIVFAVVPIWAAQSIGARNGRRYAWLWGLCLGWLGVVIVAIMGPARDPDLDALEREVRKAELEQRRAALGRG